MIALAVAGLAFAGAMFFTLRPRAHDDDTETDPRGRGLGGDGGGWFGGGGVGARESDSAAARVTGRVVDPEGVPVEGGALILTCLSGDPPGRMLSRPLRVGEEGVFSGPVCPAGETCAQFQHPHMIQDDVWVMRGGSEVELVARLLGRLEGNVYDVDGEPVAGARLTVVPPPDDDDPYGVSPFVSRHASTDADGYFYFSRIERPPCDPCSEAAGRCDPEVPEGLPTLAEMIVTVRSRGHRLAEARVDAEETGPLQLVLEAPAPPLRGRLVDANGDVYARARVIATGVEKPYDREATVVRPDGIFELDELGEGTYTLRAIQDGVELAKLDEARAGEEVELEGKLSASGPDVVIAVVDEGGNPVEGVTIDGGPFSGMRTNGQGRARADRVTPGTYRIRLHGGSSRGLRRELVVEAGETAMEVVFEL